VAQGVKHLLCKHEALTSNPSTTKKKKEEEEEERKKYSIQK
jgi:hypothetical protein